jgi:hypothetical protein
MYCNNCGNEIVQADATSCNNCGCRLGQQVASENENKNHFCGKNYARVISNQTCL